MNIDSGKTVLITGATGLIGSCLVNRLMRMDNVRVIALSRSKTKLQELFAEYIEEENFSFIAQDVSSPFPKLKEAVDYIYHAASPISGAVIKQNPVDVIMPNIQGTMNCLEFLREQKYRTGVSGRLVLFSSATVYSNASEDGRVVTEEETSVADNIDAQNAPYSESKRLVEVLAKAYYKQYGVDSVIARFSYVYGYTYYQPNTAFYEFINRAINGEDIVLNNSAIPRRDNIYVEDAVEGILHLAIMGESAESYNISSGGELNNFAAVDEIADVIAENVNKLMKASVKVTYLNKIESKRLPGILLDNAKIKSLGWTLKYSMEQGVSETIRKYITYMRG